MPTSIMRRGKRSAKYDKPVPDGIAAVIATIFSSVFAISDSVSAITCP